MRAEARAGMLAVRMRAATVRKRKDLDIGTLGCSKEDTETIGTPPPSSGQVNPPSELHARSAMGVACGVHVRSIALIFCVLAASAAAFAADLTADQAYELVVQKPWAPKPPPKQEDLAAARKALENAAAKQSAS